MKVWGRIGMSADLTQDEINNLCEKPEEFMANNFHKFKMDGETYFPANEDDNFAWDFEFTM